MFYLGAIIKKNIIDKNSFNMVRTKKIYLVNLNFKLNFILLWYTGFYLRYILYNNKLRS